MFTLHKLAVLIAIIGAAWYGFRLIERLQGLRRASMGAGAVDKAGRVGRQDLQRCDSCGVFVPGGHCTTCSNGVRR